MNDARDAAPPTEAAFGLGVGALVMSVSGFVWIGWGFSAQAAITVAQWIIFYVAFLALAVAAIVTLRTARARMQTHSLERDKKFWATRMRRFRIIMIVEGAGCGIVVFLALTLHRMDLLALGISLVVGAHFLPLAGLFRSPAYYVTASAIIVCDLVSSAIFKADALTVAVGIATGAILWMTSIYALARARKVIGVADSIENRGLRNLVP